MARPTKIISNKLNIKNEFKNEKELSSYIIRNIENFCLDVLDDSLIEYKYNHDITGVQEKKAINRPRIDLYLRCKKYTYGIEIKNPSQKFHELSRSVSQLLSYKVIADEYNIKMDKLILLVSDYDTILERIIAKYDLPIDIIILEKDKCYLWKYDDKYGIKTA